MGFTPTTPLNLDLNQQSLHDQVQSLKSAGIQPRPTSQTPNAFLQNGKSATVPQHVSGVTAIIKKTSDVTSKVTVSFQRAPHDYRFVDASVFVSGYKGNPSPVKMASGQSPISFSLENTGDAFAITVQANGPTGSAPLSSAPTTSAKLVSTPLATVPTPAGNGTGGGGTAGFPPDANVVVIPPYPTSSAGLAGFSLVLKLPAGFITAFTAAGFKVGIQTTATTGLVVNRAAIGKTLPNSTAWVGALTTFTWPGGSFALANTLYMSNVCPLPGDATHDYYVIIYLDPTSSGGNAYATNSTSGGNCTLFTGLTGYKPGDHTSDVDASTLSATSGTSLFCIAQILTA